MWVSRGCNCYCQKWERSRQCRLMILLQTKGKQSLSLRSIPLRYGLCANVSIFLIIYIQVSLFIYYYKALHGSYYNYIENPVVQVVKKKINKKNGGFGRTCCSPWSCHLGAQRIAKPTQRSDMYDLIPRVFFFFFGYTL